MADLKISQLDVSSGIVTGDLFEMEHDPGGVPNSEKVTIDAVNAIVGKHAIGIVMSDETTALIAGNAKVTMRMPYAFTLQKVKASLTTGSSSGVVTVDINETASSILSTKLTIDASEKTSDTAATAAVISDVNLADDAEMTFDIDTAGTNAAGLKVWLIGYRPLA